MKKRISSRSLFFFTITLFSVMTIVLLGCGKEKIIECENSEKGVLKDLTGFDGCRWIIQLSDSTKLEPINLADFDIELKENKVVCVQYHVAINKGSYCMVGKVVEIDFIE